MRGQAFSTFKILIGAVFAVTLLAIVYNLIYVSPISGIDTLKEMVKSASNAPGQCIFRESADFNGGEMIVSDMFLPVNANCLISKKPQACPSCTSCCSACSITQKSVIPVSAMCDQSGCTVYLGSKTCSNP